MIIYRVRLLRPLSLFAPQLPHHVRLVLTVGRPQDITTENKDEIISDTYKLIDVGDGLWEVDCKMITKGGENFGR